jgi:hypothetical protein
VSAHDATSGAWSPHPDSRWRAWLKRHPQLSFLLLVPLAVATILAVLRVGIASVMSPQVAIAFYVLLTLPVWLVTNATTSLAHRALAPWRPPLWVLCFVGSLAQALLLSPFYRYVFEAAQPFLLPGVRLAAKPMPEWSFRYVVVLLSELAPGAIVWVGANYAWERLLGIRRFRYANGAAQTAAAESPRQTLSPSSQPSLSTSPASSALPASSTSSAQVMRPPFLSKSRLPPDAEVLALTAEEHYVRVITDRGADLIRYRFSEALAELAAETRGMQVHRSWWLRLDAVVDAAEKGRSMELALRDGTVVPVSFAFREAVLLARGRMPSPPPQPSAAEK